MANEKSGDLGAENRRLIYQQLCESYRAIDSFRTALLGLLPLVSGAGAFLLLNDVLTDPTKSSVAKQFLGPIGVFGFVITLGLFFYEIYGIRKCGALINAGKHLESTLGTHGQFSSRPRQVANLINEPFAAGVIYPAVLAAWTYLAFVSVWPRAALLSAILVFIIGFTCILIYDWRLRTEVGQTDTHSQAGAQGGLETS